MTTAKISQKYQIVIPKEARKEMKVEAGDHLWVETLHGITLLMPKPQNVAEKIRGLSKDIYSKHYLKRERKSWKS